MGVQYSLWGGSILNLGTERHRRQYFDDIDRFRLPGCFAMTEVGGWVLNLLQLPVWLGTGQMGQSIWDVQTEPQVTFLPSFHPSIPHSHPAAEARQQRGGAADRGDAGCAHRRVGRPREPALQLLPLPLLRWERGGGSGQGAGTGRAGRGRGSE